MKTNAGLWIDHREAIIVVLSKTGEATKRILSGVEKQHAQEVPADDIRERVHTEQLSHYYAEIMSHLSEAGSILIFGPGEAKGELKKQFETQKSETRSIALETTDNMTEAQVAARVRRHFHRDGERASSSSPGS